MEIDNIYNMDCLEGMRQMEAESVDLTVTSPPYDKLRKYGCTAADWNFDKFKAIAAESGWWVIQPSTEARPERHSVRLYISKTSAGCSYTTLCST